MFIKKLNSLKIVSEIEDSRMYQHKGKGKIILNDVLPTNYIGILRISDDSFAFLNKAIPKLFTSTELDSTL